MIFTSTLAAALYTAHLVHADFIIGRTYSSMDEKGSFAISGPKDATFSREALCSEAHDQHNGTKALTELLWSSQVEPRPEPYYNNEQERDEWEEQYEQWSRTMNENMKSTNHTLCSDAEDDQHDIPIPGCDARYVLVPNRYLPEDVSQGVNDEGTDCGGLWEQGGNGSLIVNPGVKFGRVVDRDERDSELMSCYYATAMEACESKNETDTHPRAAPARVFGDVVCLGMACGGEFQRPKLPGKNKFGCSRELDQWEQSDIDALRLNQTALSNGTDPLSPGASEKDLEESADSGHAEAPIQGEGGLCCQYKEEEDRSCAAVAHKEQWRAVNGNTDGWKWPPPYDGWGYNIWY